MPRRPRVVVLGVPYHITQRGNNRQPVFFTSDDRRHLELLGRLARRHGMRILGYCLITNHVHLIAVPESQDFLARALGHAHSEWALALSSRVGGSGHLWQNRFFSCSLYEPHLYSAVRYIERNPVRPELAPWEWPWSSAHAHTVDSAMDAVLDFQWKEYFARWNFAEWMEILSAAMDEGDLEAMRRATRTGEPLGSREFLVWLERRTGKPLRVRKRGRPKPIRQPAEEAARQGCLF